VVQGSRLLYDRLPVHSLGEGELCRAVCDHLAQPCIRDAPLLLEELTDAAGVDVAALRRSLPSLAQRPDCLAAAVQDAVQESRAFWMELCAVLAAQRAARPTRARVVRSSLCLHRRQRKLLTKAWQTRACDPSTGPACAGLLRGVVSRERRALFSNAVELADVLAMGGAARVFFRCATTGVCRVSRGLRQPCGLMFAVSRL
jgi:hypothetical protein